MASKPAVRLSEEEMNELKQLSERSMDDIYLSIGKSLQMRDERVRLMGIKSIEEIRDSAKKFMKDNSAKLRKMVCPIYRRYKKDPETYNEMLASIMPVFGKNVAVPIIAFLMKKGLDIFCKG